MNVEDKIDCKIILKRTNYGCWRNCWSNQKTIKVNITNLSTISEQDVYEKLSYINVEDHIDLKSYIEANYSDTVTNKTADVIRMRLKLILQIFCTISQQDVSKKIVRYERWR